jgi:hypothetical protein
MQQQLPHKPSYISDADWQHILERDKRACARCEKCARNGRAPCSIDLDVDHRQPVELGGDDSFANARLYCRGPNRGRAVEPWTKWAEKNFWDSKMSMRKLREIQQLAGPDAIDEVMKNPTIDQHRFRRQLLGSITLLPGATGIGKTILTQAILHKINAMIGQGYPRIRHVLWLCTDTTLRDLAALEIENEAYEHRIVGSKPRVDRVMKGFSDLVRGPQGADVMVATSQTLWKVEKAKGIDGLRRSDREIRGALEPFDTIIFDEGDWAAGEVRYIATLANHALQFAPSASPLIDETMADDVAKVLEFRKRFVLISPEAVADYKRARELDACLKGLEHIDACLKGLQPPIVGADHSGWQGWDAGNRKDGENKITNDHALFRGLILEAVKEADQFETRMKDVLCDMGRPDDWWSPHIMVRMDSIGDVKAMMPQLNIQLGQFRDSGKLLNEGWQASMIFANHDRLVDWTERDLSATDSAGEFVHPFMRSKNNDGRADHKCKRILIMCNIGLRGINNWPIQTIVDCTSTISQIEMIQFCFGRAIRWSKLRADWIHHPKLDQFTQMSLSVAPRDNVGEKVNVINAAKNFIENMQELITNSGLLTWQDLFDGAKTSDAQIETDPSNRPLARHEKYRLQADLAADLEEHGWLDLDRAGAMIEKKYWDRADRVRERMFEYAKRLIDDPRFRAEELGAVRTFKTYAATPVCVIDRLHPQENYNIDTLIRWIRSDPFYKSIGESAIVRLKEGDVVTIQIVSRQLRDVQTDNYRATERTHTLYGKEPKGVIIEVADELAKELYESGQANKGDHDGPIRIAVISATKKLFGIEVADVGGPLDHAPYHIAILGKYRRDIQSMAYASLVRHGDLGEAIRGLAEYGRDDKAAAA